MPRHEPLCRSLQTALHPPVVLPLETSRRGPRHPRKHSRHPGTGPLRSARHRSPPHRHFFPIRSTLSPGRGNKSHLQLQNKTIESQPINRQLQFDSPRLNGATGAPARPSPLLRKISRRGGARLAPPTNYVCERKGMSSTGAVNRAQLMATSSRRGISDRRKPFGD
jgi:hypothetical protein